MLNKTNDCRAKSREREDYIQSALSARISRKIKRIASLAEMKLRQSTKSQHMKRANWIANSNKTMTNLTQRENIENSTKMKKSLDLNERQNKALRNRTQFLHNRKMIIKSTMQLKEGTVQKNKTLEECRRSEEKEKSLRLMLAKEQQILALRNNKRQFAGIVKYFTQKVDSIVSSRNLNPYAIAETRATTALKHVRAQTSCVGRLYRTPDETALY
jgi:hypothetical protein